MGIKNHPVYGPHPYKGRAYRQRHAAKLRAKLEASRGSEDTCVVFGCDRPTGRATGKRLSPNYCQYHKELLERHGSTWARTPKVSETNPYCAATIKVGLSVNQDETRGGGVTKGGRSPTGVTPPPRRSFFGVS